MTQDPLFVDPHRAQFSLFEMDAAYQDGVEDTCDKIIGLIQQSDFTIPMDELLEFLYIERSFSGEDALPFNTIPVRDPEWVAEMVANLNEEERQLEEEV